MWTEKAFSELMAVLESWDVDKIYCNEDGRVWYVIVDLTYTFTLREALEDVFHAHGNPACYMHELHIEFRPSTWNPRDRHLLYADGKMYLFEDKKERYARVNLNYRKLVRMLPEREYVRLNKGLVVDNFRHLLVS